MHFPHSSSLLASCESQHEFPTLVHLGARNQGRRFAVYARAVYSHHKFGHAVEGMRRSPHVSYIVCAVPRSGSSLLCDMLAATELAGAPTEYFDDNQREVFAREWGVAPDAEEYLRRDDREEDEPERRVRAEGVHFDHLLRRVRAVATSTREFPDLQLVYIRRRDHVRQAVSWARAIQTGQWASDHPSLRSWRAAFRRGRDREL